MPTTRSLVTRLTPALPRPPRRAAAALLLLTAAGCGAPDGTGGEPAGDGSGEPPVAALAGALDIGPLRISPSRPSFGPLCPGATATRSVTLKNRGGASLRLRDATATDPFTIRSPSPLPRTLARNGEVTLRLRYAAPEDAPLPGDPPAEGTLTIETSNRDFPFIDVPLRATIARPRLSASPEQLDFGDLTVGRSDTLDIDLFNEGDCSLRIEDADVEGDTQTVEIRRLRRGTLASGDSTTIGVRVRCEASGSIRGTVHVLGGGGEDLATVRLAGRCRR